MALNDLDISKRRKDPEKAPAVLAGLRTEYNGAGSKTITDGTNKLTTSASTPTGTALKPTTGPQPASLSGLRANPTVKGTTVGNGYTFNGSAGDAARFMEPTGVNADTVAAMQSQFAQLNPAPALAKAPTIEMPKYLGPESGLGWKTRLGKYKEELDAYNKTTGNTAAMNIEAMKEAGAGSRSLLVADTARAGLEADAPLRAAQTNKYNADAGLEQTKTDMQLKLANPNTPPEERARIEKTFAALHGTAAPKNHVIAGQKITVPSKTGGPEEKVLPPQVVDPVSLTYVEATPATPAKTFRIPTEADKVKMRANAANPFFKAKWAENFGDAAF